MNYHYYVLQKNKLKNTTVSLRKTINANANVMCSDLKDVVPPCLQSFSHNNYSKRSPLHVTMEEHDNIMDENNSRENIEFKRSV